MVLQALERPDEVRSPAGLAPRTAMKPSEAALAEVERLMDTSGDVDLDAVTAGRTLTWRSGIVEGNVNRTETIER